MVSSTSMLRTAGSVLVIAVLIVVAGAAAVPRAVEPGPFVMADGSRLLAPDGSPLLLRGIGLGNWLLAEGYMFRFDDGPESERQIRALVAELIGPDEARRFWRAWRDTYVTREDVQFIAREGRNSDAGIGLTRKHAGAAGKIAVLVGLLTYRVQHLQLEREVADLGRRGVLALLENVRLVMEREQTGAVTAVREVLEQSDPPVVFRAGRFVYVQIHDRTPAVLAEKAVDDQPGMDAVRSFVAGRPFAFPAPGEEQVAITRIGDASFVFVSAALADRKGRTAAFARGMFAVSQQELAVMRRAIIRNTMIVIAIVLALSIVVILILVCSPVAAISKADLISHYKGQSSPMMPIPAPTVMPTQIPRYDPSVYPLPSMPIPPPTATPTAVPTEAPSNWPYPIVPDIYIKTKSSYHDSLSEIFSKKWEEWIFSDDTAVSGKPNIYLYSDQDLPARVRLAPEYAITISDPVYRPGTGWLAEIRNGSPERSRGFPVL